MKYTIAMLLIASIFLTSCGSSTPPEPTLDVATLQASMIQTALATIAVQPTSTAAPQATNTAIPVTDTPVPSGSGSDFAWNYIANQQSGGLTIEIARFALADKSAIPDIDFTSGGAVQAYDDRPVVAEIIFKITNTTEQIISVYPDQGKVLGGTEQIDLMEFAMFGEFGDDFSGDIYPGVTVIGGIWLGFKRTPIDQINSVTIVIDAPHDQNYNTLGPAFNIILDLSNRQFQPFPAELN